MPERTAELFPVASATDLPEGFVYRENFLDETAEGTLLANFRGLEFAPYEFRGVEARRRVIAFGYQHDYKTRRIQQAQEIPTFLLGLREQAALFAQREPADFAQALVSEYRPGTPIGWHRDREHYELVVGISLLSPALLRFRQEGAEGWHRARQLLAPRSAYLLAGEARGHWQHSIPPVEALRYSVTFRTLRRN